MKLKASLLGLGLLTIAQIGIAGADHNTLRFIIKYKQQSTKLTALKKQITQSTQLPIKAMSAMANGAYSLILDAPQYTKGDATDSILENLRKNPEVQYAVKDRVGHFKPVPEPTVNQELYQLLSHDSQWDEFARPAGIMLESKPGLKDGAWAQTTGKSLHPIVVAVLDTGVTLNDSLVNSLLKDSSGAILGWNFAGNNRNVLDETTSYHGAHVSGTIAGYGDVMNGVGPDLRILTVKIPDQSGMFYESAVVNGIYWSVGGDVPGVPHNMHPAKVLNMSFGVDIEPGKESDYCDEALQEAVFYARNKGAVLIAAAGNDNRWEHYNAPGVCNGTVKVASTGPEGLRSYFSNYGPGVMLAAPGGDKRYGSVGGILSTVNPGGGYNASGFDFYQGTSMASPHVAAVAGLIYSVNGNLKPEQVEQILYTTTHDFGKSTDANKSCVGKKPCGHGILDAENAVNTALAGYDILFTAPKVINACTKDALQTIKMGSAIWLQQKGCDNTVASEHPQVKQAKDGSISAYYGSTLYTLDQTGYKECHIVGYDGVGCFF